MESQILPSQNLSERVYPLSHFYAATILTGPLVGAYIMAENFQALGQPEKARTTWTVAAFFCVALLLILEGLGDRAQHTGILIPLSYAIAGRELMRYYQSKQIEGYIAAGGATYTWQKTLGISVLGLLITVTLFCAAGFLLQLVIGMVTGK